MQKPLNVLARFAKRKKVIIKVVAIQTAATPTSVKSEKSEQISRMKRKQEQQRVSTVNCTVILTNTRRVKAFCPSINKGKNNKGFS